MRRECPGGLGEHTGSLGAVLISIVCHILFVPMSLYAAYIFGYCEGRREEQDAYFSEKYL